jgi:hypothetical protein
LNIGLSVNKLSEKIQIQLEKLYLTFDHRNCFTNENQINYSELTSVIKIFSLSLKFLSLNLVNIKHGVEDDIILNGLNLQEQLLESMIYLKEFHLYVKINRCRIEINKILATFQNQFWFDHNWYFGIHGDYLYTLPFNFEEMYDFSHFDDIESSNNDILINNSRLWYHVTSIHMSISSKIDTDLLKLFKIKIPKLKSITINRFYWRWNEKIINSYLCVNKNDINNAKQDNLTTIYFNGGSLETEKRWFIHFLPNLKHLNLDSTPLPVSNSELVPIVTEKIQRLDIFENFMQQISIKEYLYFINLEYLVIHLPFNGFMVNRRNCIGFIMKLLTKMKTLKTVFIYFSEFFDIQVNPTRDHSRHPINIVENMFEQFRLNTMANNYELKHFFNWITISKKKLYRI